MRKQTVEFAVKRDNGTITRVGRTGILQPKPDFKGGCVKWLEYKPKHKSKQIIRVSGFCRVRFSTTLFNRPLKQSTFK